jgi:hypothetical protein
MVKLLAENNALSSSVADCDYLANAVDSWVRTTGKSTISYNYAPQADDFGSPVLLWAQILPVRCQWQHPSGVITVCPKSFVQIDQCQFWDKYNPVDPADATPEYFAASLGMRVGGIVQYAVVHQNVSTDFIGGLEDFQVRAIFNHNDAVSFT